MSGVDVKMQKRQLNHPVNRLLALIIEMPIVLQMQQISDKCSNAEFSVDNARLLHKRQKLLRGFRCTNKVITGVRLKWLVCKAGDQDIQFRKRSFHGYALRILLSGY
ncbi:hypothetical protein SERVES_04277 [Serratia ficaria]|nr:hypothetical protein SERVES_04277 [Serratia ficaria]